MVSSVTEESVHKSGLGRATRGGWGAIVSLFVLPQQIAVAVRVCVVVVRQEMNSMNRVKRVNPPYGLKGGCSLEKQKDRTNKERGMKGVGDAD